MHLSMPWHTFVYSLERVQVNAWQQFVSMYSQVPFAAADINKLPWFISTLLTSRTNLSKCMAISLESL